MNVLSPIGLRPVRVVENTPANDAHGIGEIKVAWDEEAWWVTLELLDATTIRLPMGCDGDLQGAVGRARKELGIPDDILLVVEDGTAIWCCGD